MKKEFTAYHVPASGEEEPTKITRTEPFTLEELQHYVGGYIEGLFTVPNPDTNEYDGQYIMVLNELGRSLNLPPNRRVIEKLNRLVVGDVLIMQKELFD